MSDELKIATVVVTYNRLELLKECIDSLRNQTRKIDEIFVINNSSTDGTEEWLKDQTNLTTITQPNSGGAGGFYTGMKTAYEKGYDWIWVMDDDGLPLANALEELLNHTNSTVGVLNSLIVSKLNNEELVFGIEDYYLREYYTRTDEVKNKIYIRGANFFNGTLISKETISVVGYPNPLFFIYGDELEFLYRIKNANILIMTISNSILEHPPQTHRYIGKWIFYHKIILFNSLNVKFLPRNLMAICYFYEEYTFRRLIKTFIFDLLGILFLQKNIIFATRYIKSIFNGILFIKKLKQESQIISNKIIV